MLIALLFVILVFIIGGLCMYILAKFVESGKKKDEFRPLNEKPESKDEENKTAG